MTWPYESVVGPNGGSDLTNGYCTIHAATSSATASGPLLKLSLDIEFLSSAYLSSNKYIYLLVVNNQGQYSNGSTWQNWGWWATPNR